MSGKIDSTEVARHASGTSCWLVIDGKVWDVTDFLQDHPGGTSVLLANAGRDATEAFDEVHDREILTETLPSEACLGEVQGEPGSSSPSSSPQASPQASSPSLASQPSPTPQHPPLSSIVSVDDFERVAQPYLSAAGWAYYSSGAEDEISMTEARALFRKISLRARVLRVVEPVSTQTRILGFPSSLPLYITPTGIGRYAHREAESLLSRVAGEEGLIYCIPSATNPLDAVFDARITPDQPLFFQLYASRDRAKTEALVRRAEALGARAIFLTVDSPVLGRRERDDRARPPPPVLVQAAAPSTAGGVAKTSAAGLLNPLLVWDDVAWLRGFTQLPVVIKGIQTVEDAVLAYRSGVQGIVLSHHGGRSLDTAQSPMLTLLEIRRHAPELLSAEARTEKKFQVLLDGGIRRGTDVLKAMALGASAVGIGRPFLYAMTNEYGLAGLRRLVAMFRAEIETSMALLGARTLEDLVPEMINAERVEGWVSRRIKL